jgi:hypothetical protein
MAKLDERTRRGAGLFREIYPKSETAKSRFTRARMAHLALRTLLNMYRKPELKSTRQCVAQAKTRLVDVVLAEASGRQLDNGSPYIAETLEREFSGSRISFSTLKSSKLKGFYNMHITPSETLLAPPGSHTALITAILDRGTQSSESYGDKPEMSIRFELSDEPMPDGKPYSIAKIYTKSLHRKSTLRGHLDALGIEVKIGEAFDVKSLLGKPVLITVIHQEGESGMRAKVVSVAKLPKSVKVPKPVSPLTFLSLTRGEFDKETFAALHEKTREVIAKSPEYQLLMKSRKDIIGGDEIDF